VAPPSSLFLRFSEVANLSAHDSPRNIPRKLFVSLTRWQDQSQAVAGTVHSFHQQFQVLLRISEVPGLILLTKLCYTAFIIVGQKSVSSWLTDAFLRSRICLP
jgi:hypothetical protein